MGSFLSFCKLPSRSPSNSNRRGETSLINERDVKSTSIDNPAGPSPKDMMGSGGGKEIFAKIQSSDASTVSIDDLRGDKVNMIKNRSPVVRNNSQNYPAKNQKLSNESSIPLHLNLQRPEKCSESVQIILLPHQHTDFCERKV